MAFAILAPETVTAQKGDTIRIALVLLEGEFNAGDFSITYNTPCIYNTHSKQGSLGLKADSALVQEQAGTVLLSIASSNSLKKEDDDIVLWELSFEVEEDCDTEKKLIFDLEGRSISVDHGQDISILDDPVFLDAVTVMK